MPRVLGPEAGAVEQLAPERGEEALAHRVVVGIADRAAAMASRSSVGSVGDSYDNALAETIIGPFKAEVIRRSGPRTNLDEVGFATLEWVGWFNHRRLSKDVIPSG